jgi:hypothetical protein
MRQTSISQGVTGSSNPTNGRVTPIRGHGVTGASIHVQHPYWPSKSSTPQRARAQIWFAYAWPGRWRIVALVPIIGFVAALFYTLAGLERGSNLWPFSSDLLCTTRPRLSRDRPHRSRVRSVSNKAPQCQRRWSIPRPLRSRGPHPPTSIRPLCITQAFAAGRVRLGRADYLLTRKRGRCFPGTARSVRPRRTCQVLHVTPE